MLMFDKQTNRHRGKFYYLKEYVIQKKTKQSAIFINQCLNIIQVSNTIYVY